MDLIQRHLIEDRDKKYEKMYVDHYSAVKKYIQNSFTDSSFTDDLIQETFFEAYKKFDEIENHPSQLGWLLRTAKFKMNNMRRRILHNDCISLDVEDIEIPLKVYGFDEKETELLFTIFEPDDRRILVDYFILNYSPEQIARCEGISGNHVRVKIFRLKEKLKKLII